MAREKYIPRILLLAAVVNMLLPYVPQDALLRALSGVRAVDAQDATPSIPGTDQSPLSTDEIARIIDAMKPLQPDNPEYLRLCAELTRGQMGDLMGIVQAAMVNLPYLEERGFLSKAGNGFAISTTTLSDVLPNGPLQRAVPVTGFSGFRVSVDSVVSANSDGTRTGLETTFELYQEETSSPYAGLDGKQDYQVQRIVYEVSTYLPSSQRSDGLKNRVSINVYDPYSLRTESGDLTAQYEIVLDNFNETWKVSFVRTPGWTSPPMTEGAFSFDEVLNVSEIAGDPWLTQILNELKGSLNAPATTSRNKTSHHDVWNTRPSGGFAKTDRLRPDPRLKAEDMRAKARMKRE